MIMAGSGAWLTIAMYTAVELLPVGTVGSLYHAIWTITIVIAARYQCWLMSISLRIRIFLIFGPPNTNTVKLP